MSDDVLENCYNMYLEMSSGRMADSYCINAKLAYPCIHLCYFITRVAEEGISGQRVNSPRTTCPLVIKVGSSSSTTSRSSDFRSKNQRRLPFNTETEDLTEGRFIVPIATCIQP